MALFLLDTTTLTHLRNGHLRVASGCRHHKAVGDSIGVTSVNVEEVLSGWLAFLRQARTPDDEAQGSRLLNEAVFFLSQFPLIAVTPASVLRHATLRKMKLNVGRNDLRLAALALELGATVVTDNARDFSRVPGLTWVDWTK